MTNITPESVDSFVRHLNLSGYRDYLDKQNRKAKKATAQVNPIPKGFLNKQKVIELLQENIHDKSPVGILHFFYNSQYYFFSDDPDFGYIYKHENTLDKNNLLPEFKRRPIGSVRITTTEFILAVDSLGSDKDEITKIEDLALYVLQKREQNKLFKKINDNHYIVTTLESFKAALKDYEQTAKTAWPQNSYKTIVLEGHYPAVECLVSFSHRQDRIGTIRSHVIDTSTLRKIL